MQPLARWSNTLLRKITELDQAFRYRGFPFLNSLQRDGDAVQSEKGETHSLAHLIATAKKI